MFIKVSCTCYAIMLTAVIMIQGRDGANKNRGLRKIITQSTIKKKVFINSSRCTFFAHFLKIVYSKIALVLDWMVSCQSKTTKPHL